MPDGFGKYDVYAVAGSSYCRQAISARSTGVFFAVDSFNAAPFLIKVLPFFALPPYRGKYPAVLFAFYPEDSLVPRFILKSTAEAAAFLIKPLILTNRPEKNCLNGVQKTVAVQRLPHQNPQHHQFNKARWSIWPPLQGRSHQPDRGYAQAGGMMVSGAHWPPGRFRRPRCVRGARGAAAGCPGIGGKRRVEPVLRDTVPFCKGIGFPDTEARGAAENSWETAQKRHLCD